MRQNDVKSAIYNMGGPTKAGNTLLVSTNTVHNWIRREKIPRLEMAQRVAKASGFDLDRLRPVRQQIRYV